MRAAWHKLPTLVTYILVTLALALGVLWLIPANAYIILPGSAQPVASLISVNGHRSASTSGGLYDTYVNEFKATHLLYVLFGLIRSDVSVEPASAVSSGCPDPQYERELMAMMADSKIQAEAAALHVLGYKVTYASGSPQISEVSCNVPAANILKTGDEIVAIDGKRTRTFKEVQKYTEAQQPGSVLHLTIRRRGRIIHKNVRTVHADPLGNIISSGGHAMIGIVMTMPLKFPVKVHIHTGDVGGPSAGLAFALGIVQQLSHKDLTHGNRVAVTGTITYQREQLANGKVKVQALVGAIGGARQKALAAQAAGAQYFLVPVANYAEARSAHAHLRVISVRTLSGALHILKNLPSHSTTKTASG